MITIKKKHKWYLNNNKKKRTNNFGNKTKTMNIQRLCACYVCLLFFFTRFISIPVAKIELAFFLCFFGCFLSTIDDFFTFRNISVFESDSLGWKDRCGSITRSKSFLRTENISQYVRARTSFSRWNTNNGETNNKTKLKKKKTYDN